MSRTRGEEAVEKWRCFAVEMDMKRGGGELGKVEAKNKNKREHAWDHPCLLGGALGQVGTFP